MKLKTLYLSSRGDQGMSEAFEEIRRLVDACSDEDRRALKLHLQKMFPHPLEQEWGIDSDTILSAISRSSDLTRRGVRGIIAEAVFVNNVIPSVRQCGWNPVDFGGDLPYDALLRKGERQARIQVKLQRLESGAPKLYYPKHYPQNRLYVVEVQKTRTGEAKQSKQIPTAENAVGVTASDTVKTRPYKFGDFDILAVNMHPSSRNWKSFRYTVTSWLLPRTSNAELIEIFQPVADTPNDVWTDDLATCLNWFEEATQRRVLEELVHRKKGPNTGARS